MTTTIYSSNGELTVSAETGEVLSCVEYEDSEGALSDIRRFDLAEFKATYPDADLADAHLDILDVGFWADNGKYTGPELDWRNEGRGNLGGYHVAQEAEEPRRDWEISDKDEALRLAMIALNQAVNFDTGIEDADNPGKTLSSYKLLSKLSKFNPYR